MAMGHCVDYHRKERDWFLSIVVVYLCSQDTVHKQSYCERLFTDRPEIVSEMKDKGVIYVKRFTTRKNNEHLPVSFFFSTTAPKSIKADYCTINVYSYIPNHLRGSNAKHTARVHLFLLHVLTAVRIHMWQKIVTATLKNAKTAQETIRHSQKTNSNLEATNGDKQN